VFSIEIIWIVDDRSEVKMIEVFYGTQYDPTVVRSYYRFFSIGKMVI
jgi:hypothetical protein